MAETCAASDNDLAGRKSSLISIWWLPAAAMVAAMFVSSPLRTAVWTAALGWMGGACFLNAYRCSRVHCYFTGPLYLLGALTSLLHGLDIVSLGPHGWAWIGYTLIAGSVLLNYVPEWIWGRYGQPNAG